MKLQAQSHHSFISTIILLVLVILGCDSSNEGHISAPAAFVGSQQCKTCHKEAYDDWLTSDHFLAMQPANDTTVLGDFNDVVLEADGIQSRFFKREGKFIIHTEGHDGKYHDFEVLYAFGYFPLQQYLIAFPGGRMQATRASWDTREKKWFHQYTGQTIAHWDWLHWTGNAQNWNTMCASCHSTNLVKDYSDSTDTYNTTWDEINVSCESCHGPGSTHISFIQSGAYEKGKRIPNAGFWYGRDTIAQLQLNTCASCHARKTDVTTSWQHSGEILDNLIPQVISSDFYFADGQIREEVYEYGSFTQSKMFAHNVRCSSCHNPHSGKVRLEGNNLCLSCHKAEYATRQHHFHQEHGEGSLCVNCHMTTRTYMGNDHRRDHSFRVPRPDQTVRYATPNACNQCHKDKPAAWAAEKVVEWYGPTRKHHFSDDLIPGSLLNDQSEMHLVRLIADTTQPEIARATAAYYLGQIQTQGAVDALLEAIDDSKAHLRYSVIRSLENFPSDYWKAKALDALNDPVRSVRIASADLFHRIGQDQIPSTHKAAFTAAQTENLTFLQSQTDFAVGNIMLADYHMQGGHYQEAIQYYRKGLRKDSLMNYARLNLATTYNLVSRNESALAVLKDASNIDPLNGQIDYNLALLHYEMGHLTEAGIAFQQAIRKGVYDPGVYYNFGLLLQESGQLEKAEEVMLEGIRLSPQATSIRYALAVLYLQTQRAELAREHIQVLKQLDPANPEFQGLFTHPDLQQ